MILIMKNDYVILYDMTLEEFESLDELSNLEKYEFKKILKEDFSSEWLGALLGKLCININVYYYDNGSKLVRKDISDLSEIEYYKDDNGRLWPSLEYYKMTEKRTELDPMLEKLIEKDNALNKAMHINNLLTLEQKVEFDRYYSKLYINSNSDIVGANILGKAYEVPCYCKLILKDDIDRLTSGKLNGCVFLIVIPAGIDSNNEMKYFVHPYEITKSDTKSLSKVYKQVLNEAGVKTEELTNVEKVNYLEKAVKKYLKEEIYMFSSIQIGGTSYTWKEYTKIFKNTYKIKLDDIFDKRNIFEKRLVDARLVEDEKIVPLTIEYARQLNIVNNKVVESEEDLSQLTHVNPSTLDLLSDEPEDTITEEVQEEVVEKDNKYYDEENNRVWISKEAYEQHKKTGEPYYMVGGVCRLLVSTIDKENNLTDAAVLEEEIVKKSAYANNIKDNKYYDEKNNRTWISKEAYEQHKETGELYYMVDGVSRLLSSDISNSKYYDEENNRTWISKEAYEQHKKTGETYYMVDGVCQLLTDSNSKSEEKESVSEIETDNEVDTKYYDEENDRTWISKEAYEQHKETGETYYMVDGVCQLLPDSNSKSEEKESVSEIETDREVDTKYYDEENNRIWISKEAYEQHKENGIPYYMVGGVCQLLPSTIDIPVIESTANEEKSEEVLDSSYVETEKVIDSSAVEVPTVIAEETLDSSDVEVPTVIAEETLDSSDVEVPTVEAEDDEFDIDVFASEEQTKGEDAFDIDVFASEGPNNEDDLFDVDVFASEEQTKNVFNYDVNIPENGYYTEYIPNNWDDIFVVAPQDDERRKK